MIGLTMLDWVMEFATSRQYMVQQVNKFIYQDMSDKLSFGELDDIHKGHSSRWYTADYCLLTWL
ncbi:MAG UNVERIFIED_CONTAM: hypothetical protein LVQ98_05295 [Rickettsiaceae bacterium]|jgi:hypothetical protein